MNQVKTRQINFRLSYEQLKKIKKKSDDLGITPSEFLRGMIDGYIPNVRLNLKLSHLINEMRRIGVNINQIAKVANQTGYINQKYLNSYKDELDKNILEINKLIKLEKVGDIYSSNKIMEN